MDVYSDISTLPARAKDCVLAIGNFDGMHRGHQALLTRGKALAQTLGKRLGVLTFEPHPRKLFRPDDPPFRITPLPAKQRLLEKCGVDSLFNLTFDWDFASQSAEDFIARILQKGIEPAAIIIGHDFRFGQLRKGSVDTLKDAGFAVHTLEIVMNEQGRRYSSTAVREALQQGDIRAANAILGWDWEIEGPVFRGDRRGHDLGYPTANVMMGETLHPAYGIYATLVQIEGEDLWRPAATNIGIRPMFEVREGQVEAYILNFEDRDIYGKILRIRPVERLRGEAKFTSLEELKAQMARDCEQARKILT